MLEVVRSYLTPTQLDDSIMSAEKDLKSLRKLYKGSDEYAKEIFMETKEKRLIKEIETYKKNKRIMRQRMLLLTQNLGR